jgi:amino acid permease
MRILKYVLGALASLYTLAQLVSLGVMLLNFGQNENQPYVGSMLFGKVAGICIGAAIAFMCFRKTKPKP